VEQALSGNEAITWGAWEVDVDGALCTPAEHANLGRRTSVGLCLQASHVHRP
jgi:hypothetical protein